MKALELIKKLQKEIKEHGDLPIVLVINDYNERHDPYNWTGSFSGTVNKATGHVQTCIYDEEETEDGFVNSIEIEGQ